jgi:SAM-dependent methyltransferase
MKQRRPHLVEIFLEGSDESDKAYDAIYQEADLAQIESFYLWLFDHIPIPETGTLLDVSCGSGEVLQLATDRGLKAVGVEISKVIALKAAQQKSEGVTICVAAGEKLPLTDNFFDIVTNIGSLEHFIDPAEGIREMLRVLNPRGSAILLVPNTYSLLSNIWSVFRKGQIAIDDQPIQRYGARMDWIALLQANGLHVQKTIKYERPYPRSIQDLFYYFNHPKDLIRLILSPFIPTNLAYAFLFICGSENDNPQT